MNKYIIIILILLFNSFCTREKNCPGFNEKDLIYLPYKAKDTLRFKNDNDTILKIIIDSVIYSKPYVEEYKTYFNLMEWSCTDTVALFANDSRSNSKYIFLEMEQSDVSGIQYFRYNVFGFKFEFDFRNELSSIKDFEDYKLHTNYEIDSIIYDSIIIATNPNASSKGVSEVYFSRTEGIIKICENNSSIEWIIVK